MRIGPGHTCIGGFCPICEHAITKQRLAAAEEEAKALRLRVAELEVTVGELLETIRYEKSPLSRAAAHAIDLLVGDEEDQDENRRYADYCAELDAERYEKEMDALRRREECL